MEVIAAAANVSKRTLYSRFGSKTALLIAAVERGIIRHLRPIRSGIPSGSMQDKIVYAARKMLEVSLTPEAVGLVDLVYWIESHRLDGAEIQSFMGSQSGIRVFEIILEQAQPRNRPSRDDIPFIAALIFDITVTVPRHRILVRRDLPNTARAQTDYIRRAVGHFMAALSGQDEKQT